MSVTDQLKQLQQENQLMRQLATTQGFYQYYFSQLPKHRTNCECFNHCNDLHFDLFGEYKFSSWYSFRSNKNYYKNHYNK